MLRAQTAVWLIFAVAFISLSPGQAQAQECVSWSTFSCVDKPKPGAPAPAPDKIWLRVKPPGDAIVPDVRALYQVDVKCEPTQLLPAAHKGIFNRTDLVTSHVIAITGKALTGQELPTDAKVLIPVYSVSTDNANRSDFVNKTCTRSFFVSGSDPLFITATANQTQTNKPSILSNLLYTGIKLFNPIAPLFAGATAAALTPVLNGIAATQAPLKEMFSQFDAKGTQTYSYPVYLGETNIRTQYSRISLTLKKIPSIVKTDNGNFIVSFEGTLTGYRDEVRVPTLDVKAVTADCRSYAGQLIAKNFAADDVAYGLSYVTQTAGLDKEKSVACISDQYGLLSVNSFTCPPPGEGIKCLWNRFPDPLVVADFTAPYPPQKYEAPFFKSLQNTMTDYAAAIAKSAEPPSADLAKYFQDPVELEDFERLVEGKDGQMSPAEFMQQLVESGFTRFGCQGKDTQAAGMLFGFPDKAGTDNLYHSEDVVALRTWRGKPPKPGEPGKLFKVEALFQPGLVEAAAKPTLMRCGKGVHLAATPEPAKQEPKKEEPAAGAGQ